MNYDIWNEADTSDIFEQFDIYLIFNISNPITINYCNNSFIEIFNIKF